MNKYVQTGIKKNYNSYVKLTDLTKTWEYILFGILKNGCKRMKNIRDKTHKLFTKHSLKFDKVLDL